MDTRRFKPQFYVHDFPAKSLDQVIDYLSSDDPHTRSKVQWFDGDDFRVVTWQFPIDLRS